jgi:hypothetical protein
MRNIKLWERAIILVDMNAFFASIEQLDFPELQGQPIRSEEHTSELQSH